MAPAHVLLLRFRTMIEFFEVFLDNLQSLRARKLLLLVEQSAVAPISGLTSALVRALTNVKLLSTCLLSTPISGL